MTLIIMLVLIILLLFLKLFFGSLKILLYACVKIPVGLMMIAVGLTLCCTIILLPLGRAMIKAGGKMFEF